MCLRWIRMEYLWSIFISYSKACYSVICWLSIPISTCLFLDFFSSWVPDKLCQSCCLTNCAYGLGILLVFYKFSGKKTQPITTLSCGAIYTQVSIQTNSHLKCQLCYLAGFDLFCFLEVYQNFFRAMQAAFIKSFYLVCVALDFTEISPW